MLEIPVNLSVKNLFAQGNKNFKKNSGDYRILLFQLQENQFKPYLFKVENGEDSFDLKNKNLKHLNLNQIPKDFSGKYMFFNLDGGFVGSWNIVSGERTRAVSYRKPAPSESGKSNARILDWTYTCTVTTFTTYVQAGSGEPEIVAQFEVWDCEFTQVPEQIAPPDNGPGTGGEDPGCYEPHPYIEGQVVPCGSLDPECPCCSLPVSQRAACEADEPPCEDLPLKTMEIASPGASGKNGGRFGMTRTNGTQFHDGLDIASIPGSYVYSPFSGKVIDIKSSFSPGEYKRSSYGNYVTIQSIDTDGKEFIFKYNHLNYVLVNVNDEIVSGQAIGISGSTGNAASKDVTNKHLHIQARKRDSNGVIIKTNPENYLQINWDSNANIEFNPCN